MFAPIFRRFGVDGTGRKMQFRDRDGQEDVGSRLAAEAGPGLLGA
jgi:hypothetical protein